MFYDDVSAPAALFLIALGGAFLAIAWQLRARMRTFDRDGRRCMAEVIHFDRRKVGRRNSTYTYLPTFRFTDASGTVREACSTLLRLDYDFEIGSRREIIYADGEDRVILAAHRRSGSLSWIVFGLFGLGIAMAGLLALTS
ncbi:DUF3592 domain-containing protein [Jannaschia aquimarina]|uniref:DUF3592 domain-containing protein n=1 Tax=Jannaschia aquimarina TaxID=935700 RepID=A0A0D1CKI4_9RHOB|nr:DUF3592 domain-containing protein [Jannaschia aquimarina]KIT15262.1 hypothetical protein jaqu_30090 [Jannaschia aquimarina]SNS87671.1 hypothetical protein SAMN05421775_103117 [Jannaschia aquimarina]